MKLLHKSSIPIHEPDYNLRLTNWNKKLIIRLSNISSTCCSLVWCPTSMFFAMKISLSCNTNFRKNFLFFGGSRRSWTLNLTVRSGTLYPIELVPQYIKLFSYIKIFYIGFSHRKRFKIFIIFSDLPPLSPFLFNLEPIWKKLSLAMWIKELRSHINLVKYWVDDSTIKKSLNLKTSLVSLFDYEITMLSEITKRSFVIESMFR